MGTVPLSRSLVARLVSTYLVFSLLATACVGAASYLAGRALLRDAVLARLETTSRQKETDIALWLEERLRDLRFLSVYMADDLAASATGRTIAHEARFLSRYLRHFKATQPDVQEVLIMSPEGGRVLASTEPTHVGEYRAIYSYYAQGRQGPAVQSLYPSPESLRPILTLSMPVKDAQGRLLAVVAMHLGLEPIDQIIRSRAGLGQTGETYLVDTTRTLVVSEQLLQGGGRRQAATEGVTRALAGVSGQGQYSNAAGVPVLGVYRWLPSYQMALMAEMSQEEAFAPARRLALVIVLVGGLTGVCLGAGALVLSRRVARPILSVTRAAMAVADGDLSARAPVLTRDELGNLAVAFNSMTTELSGLYARLEREGQEREAILTTSFDGIAVAGMDGSIAYMNPGMERLFGYSVAEAASLAALAEFIMPDREDRNVLVASLLADMAQSGSPERVFSYVHKDGGKRWCRLKVSHMDGGKVVLNAQDITQIKASEERVRHMALHDTLTGLPNRQLFADRLDQALRRAKRVGMHVVLVFVDLDRFKSLNDAHGHAHGDRVLVETAMRLRACVRDSDTVARLGGDEFVIILTDLFRATDALPVARKILETLFQPEVAGGTMFLGASLGLACYPQNGADQDTLLIRADQAMYEAKHAGGNALRLAEGFPRD